MTPPADLEAGRAALMMINPAPYNAEAPPSALTGDVTPAELHYVRSNFAVPEHDGTLQIGGAVEPPHHAHPGRPTRDAGPRAGRDPGVRRQRPSCHEAAAHRRTLGRPRRLHSALDRGAAARLMAQVRPSSQGVDVRFEGADHGAYHLNPVLPETSRDDLTFVRSLPLGWWPTPPPAS